MSVKKSAANTASINITPDNTASSIARWPCILFTVIGALLSTTALSAFYSIGHQYAHSIGRHFRGGVGWGLNLSMMTACFTIIALVYFWFFFKQRTSRFRNGLLSGLVFLILAMLLSGTAGYPYRLAYYVLCAQIVLITPAVISGVIDRLRR
ncbi:hypothetical protein [Plesiomonas shigelloides]|uniref:hypothetical protein n=1 Tax=Plesiomonas shigelloides TaxID=703 RepID=UPI00387F02CF